MKQLQVFDEPFRSTLHERLDELGDEIRQRYELLGLAMQLSSDKIDSLTRYHQWVDKKLSLGDNSAFTQSDVFPAFPSRSVDNLDAYKSHLQAMLMIAAIIDTPFQNAVKSIANKCGMNCHVAVHSAAPKSYKQCLSREHHRNFDIVRSLIMVESPEQLLSVYKEIVDIFGGVVKTTNQYADDRDEREKRFHLSGLMVTVVCDAKQTFEDLSRVIAIQEQWAEYASNPRGEPPARWRALCSRAQDFLQSAQTKDLQVAILGEIQILLDKDAIIRHQMHAPFKAYQAQSDKQLHRDYTRSTRSRRLSVVQTMIQLENAMQSSNEDDLLEVISCIVNINMQRPKDHATPLWLAAKYGMISAVKVMLGEHANTELPDKRMTSPLYVAAERGHADVAALLLDHRADVNQERNNGATPLFAAAQHGHESVVMLLIEQNGRIDVTRSDHVSPLGIAAVEGHEQIVQLLIDSGAAPNPQVPGEVVPIVAAASTNRLEVVSTLIDCNADVNLSNTHGTNALGSAAQAGHVDMVYFLLQSNAAVDNGGINGSPPLMQACQRGHGSVISSLINLGANVNLKNESGETPLLVATRLQLEIAVSVLLKANSEPNTCRNDGISPLHIAAKNGYSSIVELLLEYNADANQAHKETSKSPLEFAVEGGHLYICSILQAAGAEINKRSGDSTPLITAIQNNRFLIAKLLFQNGAQLSQTTINSLRSHNISRKLSELLKLNVK